jgi:GT2 family glycosyltransferase
MFMLVRSQAFAEVQGFDEGFYLYCEDFDLCARLMLTGWTVDHHPDIHLRHMWQRKSMRSLFHFRNHLNSLARMWQSPVFWHYRRLLRQPGGAG